MASRRVQFPTGLAGALGAWASVGFEWALYLGTLTPAEETMVYAADIAAYELTDGSYARVAMTTPTTTVSLPATRGAPGYVRYHCDDPAFVSLAGSETAVWLGLLAVVTNDADSPIVALYPVDHDSDGSTATFNIASTGALQVSTVAPESYT